MSSEWSARHLNEWENFQPSLMKLVEEFSSRNDFGLNEMNQLCLRISNNAINYTQDAMNTLLCKLCNAISLSSRSNWLSAYHLLIICMQFLYFDSIFSFKSFIKSSRINLNHHESIISVQIPIISLHRKIGSETRTTNLI